MKTKISMEPISDASEPVRKSFLMGPSDGMTGGGARNAVDLSTRGGLNAGMVKDSGSGLNRPAWIFLLSAVLILSITGLAKLTAVLGEARILGSRDPVFWFLTNRQVLFGVAALEFAIVGAVLSKWLGVARKLGLIAWIGTLFLFYRLASGWSGHQGPCGCLGNWTELIGISDKSADFGMKILLAYILIGSVGLLALEGGRKANANR